MSKLDFTDAYHHSTVNMLQVGAFSFFIPLAPGDEGYIICIDLVLPIKWAEPPKFFCAFQKH